MDTKTARIRELNDAFRTTLVGGRVMLTQSIAALPVDQQLAIVARVKSFDAFTKDNDPYAEHDFGSFEIDGETIFWKIDYYDADCVYGANDPSNPDQTTRVLTIMLASDY